MGVLKTLLKMAILLILGAVLVGIAVMLKKSKSSGPVSFEKWPDVARNPAP
jgi:hypothetical protein